MSGVAPDARAELLALLRAVRRRWRATLALSAGARGAVLAAAVLLAGAALERALHPRGLALLSLVVVVAVAALVVALLPLLRLRRVPDDRRVARFVEERAGASIDDCLVSAVHVLDHPDGGPRSGFAALVVGRAIAILRDTPPEAVVPAERVRRLALHAGGALAVLLTAIAVMSPALSRAVETARLQFPGSIRIEVVPGDVRVAAGSPVRVHAKVHQAEGLRASLAPLLTVTAGGDRRTVEMQPSPDGFQFAFESVDRTFKYAVTAGAARSADYTVTALIAPRVKRIDVEYAYPAFTGLKPRVEEDGGDIYGPAGTRVRLRIHTDRPIARGELATGAAPASALRATSDRLLEGELVLARDDSYRIRLADADGLRSSGDTEYFIRLMDDRPPDVRILRPSADQQITPLEEVSIEARADDDYGIGHFDLVYAVAGRKERVVPFDRVTGTDVEKRGVRLIAAEDLGVKPGDVITYYARARDVARGKRATETRSDIFFLEVKPFSEEFVAAESQASAAAAGGNEIDALVAAQKEIISATWNLERRAAAGRSADDVAAVARAQAELKARVDQMTSGGGRSRRGARPPAPERTIQAALQDPGGAGNPIAAAADAMSRAVQQLEGQKTKDAITHEMAALNGLLRAQAEVRRRQVSQGSSGSGSGGNRAGQDLSALFDKELQRQQRTNYETKPSIENKPERTETKDSALDRIRDLARRQEDLSRRQRELADAALSAEDMKRQLEKLTREQMELRQQTEALARDMQRQAGSAGRDMQQATDQMRSAASELRRENAEGAAQNGQRATDQLRRIEEQMRGERGGGDRASGNLQVDAQQVAQEQRRIANEASRLEKSKGRTADDARQRLADEQERLAGRVDDVKREAERAAKSGKGAEAQAAADAARQLGEERVADRMRAAAQQMRSGGEKGPGKETGAATPQEIARALDRALDKLGGGSAEAKKLSAELERTRAIRDRLNRLEQQMREAGRGAATDGRQGGAELDKLRQEYQRELERAREATAQLGKGEQRTGTGMSTPEEEQFSRSAPGTEAFKQDRSGWESLRKDIDQSLERYEASVSDRLRRTAASDRLNAGGSDRVPDAYRAWIARYYESLAKVKK